jgi:E3 ubiquitin-protein ligase NRDP1
MIKGTLSFALNEKFLGEAFREEALTKGPIYASVSLLHKAGCKLVVGKPLPPYFPS